MKKLLAYEIIGRKIYIVFLDLDLKLVLVCRDIVHILNLLLSQIQPWEDGLQALHPLLGKVQGFPELSSPVVRVRA